MSFQHQNGVTTIKVGGLSYDYNHQDRVVTVRDKNASGSYNLQNGQISGGLLGVDFEFNSDGSRRISASRGPVKISQSTDAQGVNTISVSAGASALGLGIETKIDMRANPAGGLDPILFA